MEEEIRILTKKEAIKKLPKGKYIHVLCSCGESVLAGADWERSEILSAFDKCEIQESGINARNMGHGIAFKNEYGWWFVQTIKNK